MPHSSPDTRSFSLNLASIASDLHRVDGNVEQLLAIGSRLSRLAAEIAAACERAFVAAAEEVAA